MMFKVGVINCLNRKENGGNAIDNLVSSQPIGGIAQSVRAGRS